MQEGFESCDEFETNDCLEANGSCEKETPCDGMSFGSEKEITEYYKNYAERVGFGVKKISSKKGDEGIMYFTLACSRARKYVSHPKNLLEPNPITQTQCKARLNACIYLDRTTKIKSVFFLA